MSDRRWVKSDPSRGKCKMSIAAQEAFEFLNRLQKLEYRGKGDTASAARDRVARLAGITRAQAERVWKRWETMTTVNGDVYRALRNKYEELCLANEMAAASYDQQRRALKEEPDAVDQKHHSASHRLGSARLGSEKE